MPNKTFIIDDNVDSSFNSKDFLVSKLSFKGFNLLIETNNGESIELKNGLSKALFLEMPLYGQDGNQLSQDNILEMLGINNLGLDSVFLDDLLVNNKKIDSEESKSVENRNTEEQDKSIKEIQVKIEKQQSELNEKLEAVREAEQRLQNVADGKLIQSENVSVKTEALLEQFREKSTEQMTSNSSTKTNPSNTNNIENSVSGQKTQIKDTEQLDNSTKNIFVTAKLASYDDSGKSDSDSITNATSFDIVGTSLPGARIQLSVGGKVYTTIATSEGLWSVNNIQDLGNAVELYKVKATDNIGNESIFNGSITIDRTISINNVHLQPSDDSGLSNSDNITSVTQPEFIGVSEPNCDVLFTFADRTYSLVTDNLGRWSWKPEHPLLSGIYTYKVLVTDIAGNQGLINGDVTIDTEAPTNTTFKLSEISDTGVIGDNITYDRNPIITGISEPFSRIYIHINNESYTATSDENGNWSISLRNLSPGQYEYSVITQDVAGNASSPQVSNLIICSQDNFLSGGLDRNYDSGISDSDNITNQQCPVFSGQSEAGSEIIITINKKSYSTIARSDGSWTINTLPVLADGVYSYIITAKTIAGATATITDSITIDSIISSNSAFILESDDSGQSNSDGITSVKQPEIVGHTEPDSSIVLFFDGQNYSINADQSGSWAWKPSQELAEGIYTYQVFVTDIAGNTNTFTGKLVVDVTAPNVATFDLSDESDSGIKGDGITNDRTPTIVGSAEPETTVYLHFNGQDYSAEVDINGRWLVNLPVTPFGIYDYQVKVVDKAGNESYTSTKTIEIRDSIVTGNLYEVRLDKSDDTGSSDTDGVTNVSLPTFSGTGPIDGVVLFTVNGFSYSTTVDVHGTWSVSLTQPLNEGNNSYKVVISEPLISNNTTEMYGNVFLDTQAPTINDFFLEFDDGRDPKDFMTSVLQNKVIGYTEPFASVEINYGGQIFTVNADSKGYWDLPLVLKSGSSVLLIKATDVAGNTSQESVNVLTGQPSSDNIKSITLLSDTGTQGDWGTNSSSPTIQILSEPNVELEISFQGTSVTILGTSDSNGIYNFEVPSRLLNSNQIQDLIISIKSIGDMGSTQQEQVTLKYLKQNISFSQNLTDESDSGLKNDYITSVSYPNLEGIVTGDINASYSGDILFEGNSTPLGLNFSIVNGQIKWTFENSSKFEFSSGENRYLITIRDNFGNETSQSGTIRYNDLKLSLSASTDSGIADDFVTNVSAPSIEGIADPGELVKISFLGHNLTTTADSSGKWSIDLNPALHGAQLVDQDYQFTVTTVLEGVTAIQTEKFTYDSICLAPSIDKLLLATDKNSTLSGKGEVGSTIVLTVDGHVYNGVVDANGSWSIDIGKNIPDGDYSLDIKQIDPAGNISPTNVHTLNIDNSEPEFYLVYQGQKLEYQGGDFHGILFDNPSPGIKILYGYATPGSSIYLSYWYRGASATADANGYWAMDAKWPMGLGSTFTWTLTATGPNGQKSSINGRGWAVDNPNNPNGDLTAQLDSKSGVGHEANTATPKLVGTAQPYAKLVITIDGNQFQTYADINGNWSYTVPENLNLQVGQNYDFKVEAFHLLNGSSYKTVQSSFLVDVPETAMVDYDSIHDTGISNTDGITNDVVQELSGTTVSGTKIKIEVGGSVYNVVVDSSGIWHQTITLPGAGNFTYTATFTFPNNATQVTSGKFTVDLLAPTSSLYLSPDVDTGVIGDNRTSIETPIIKGLVNEGGSIVELIAIDGVTIPSVSVIASPSGYWQITFPESLAEGLHNYTVRLTDIAGNSTIISGTVDIVLTLDESIPLTFRLDNNVSIIDNAISDNQPIFRGTAPVGSTVFFTINGKLYSTTPSSFGTWSLRPTSPLEDGPIVYDAYYVDSMGIKSPLIPQSSPIILDTKAELTLNGLTPESNSGDATDNITNITTPTIHGLSEPDANIVLEINNNAYSARADASGNWSINLPTPLNNGQYTYVVYATDKLGNTTSTQSDLTIDTTAPIATSQIDNSVLFQGKEFINSATPTLSGTSEPDSLIIIKMEDGSEHSISVDSAGNWSFITPTPLSEGDHQY
ncbi:Ig-like domain-containing protein, partial [Vibrio metoecus]|uniref:Ig-like domain-containing protein n=1 Tax=Vibrio metoecus TaxID=1481663 RepID=UPI00215C728D